MSKVLVVNVSTITRTIHEHTRFIHENYTNHSTRHIHPHTLIPTSTSTHTESTSKQTKHKPSYVKLSTLVYHQHYAIPISHSAEYKFSLNCFLLKIWIVIKNVVATMRQILVDRKCLFCATF